MKFLNIPANYNFLESLYRYVLDNFNNNLNVSNLTIFLPSRRSVNELKRIFLKNSQKQSLFLPTLKAIGDIDYDDIVLNGLDYDSLVNYSELTKPISNIKYKLLLIKTILKSQDNINIEQSINLSKELNTFLIEVERQGLDLDDLNNIVDDEYAIHWQKILVFLKDFGKKWNKFLQDNNIVSNNTNIIKKIELYTKNFEREAPKNPIIIAGNFVSIKSTLNLIKTLSKYDNTYFIFKDYENIKDKYNIEKVDEINNNYYFTQIVEELKIDIKKIQDLKYEDYKIVDDNILQTLHLSMLPYDLTYKWHDLKANKLEHIKYIECKDIYEEFNLITYYILNYINTNSLKNIAIISSIDLADKMELYLKQWNLPVNNSFGKKFIDTKLIKYLLLVIDTYNNNFNKTDLLSLLKNEFSYFGYTKEELNKNILDFEKYVLDNKQNCDGFNSYKKNIDYYIKDEEIKQNLLNFLNKIESFFKDFNDKKSYNLKDLIILHLNIVENITKNIEDNNYLIWHINDLHQKIFDFINKNLIQQADCYNNINLKDYCAILSYILAEQSYSENYSTYPAINIISAQESRLINYDLVVITNLNDGNFPINIATDPWMSKSMRKSFGLPAKEIEIGKSAYDFIQLLSQKEVLLTRSTKLAGNTTFKSRFLQRLETFLKCNDITLNNIYNDYIESYKQINILKLDNNIYKQKPNPKPQLSVRPKKLSATNINVLKKNPYDIYAKYILKLKPLNILLETNIQSTLGTIIHKAIEIYSKNYKQNNNHFDTLKQIFVEEINKIFVDNEVLIQFYKDKFDDALQYFLDLDKKQRDNNVDVLSEIKNEYYMKNCNMNIEARVDRIDKNTNIVDIIDYKTGTCPSKTDVIKGKELQLLIEALILSKQNRYTINSLQYWQIKHKNSKIVNIINDDKKNINLDNLIENTEKLLNRLFNFFNDENNGYIATNRNNYSDYEQLSRVDDWLSN